MQTFNLKQNSTTLYGLISGFILIFTYIFFYSYFDDAFVALFVASFTLSSPTNDLRPKNVLPYFLALIIFLLFYAPIESYIPIHFSIIVVLFGLFFNTNDKVSFEVDSVKTFNRARLYLISAFCATIISLLAASILMAIHSLFSVKIPVFIEAIPYGLAPFLFCLLLEFFKLKSSQEEEKVKLQIKRLISVILIPILCLYSLVLCLYLGKLLITQNAPKGFATWPATISILIWLFIESFHDIYRLKNTWIRKLLPLPAILLLLTGVFIRVYEYGLTPDRIYLVFWCILASLIFLQFIFKSFFSIKAIIISVIVFFTVSTLPKINLDHITAYSQWQRLKTKITKLNENEINALSHDETTMAQLNTSLKLIEKVRSKDEVKSEFKKLISNNDSKEIDQLYEDITHSIKSAPEKNICIYFEESSNIFNNSKLTNYFSFHVIVKQNATYSFGDGSVEVNLEGKGGLITVKMPGEKDQIFDFEKNIKINKEAPTILAGSFKRTKFEIQLESGHICSDQPIYLNGRFYFDRI